MYEALTYEALMENLREASRHNRPRCTSRYPSPDESGLVHAVISTELADGYERPPAVILLPMTPQILPGRSRNVHLLRTINGEYFPSNQVFHDAFIQAGFPAILFQFRLAVYAGIREQHGIGIDVTACVVGIWHVSC